VDRRPLRLDVFHPGRRAIGFHPLYLAVAVGSAWDFLTHTPYVGKLRWFDGWANTPSNHRVHHARNARYFNKNFGGALIVWDRMFGTYEPEHDDEPRGLLRPSDAGAPE
jgi:sterol desaturase/sphingolipid hydroxylase (fatty acid hydroxylase superfamily)